MRYSEQPLQTFRLRNFKAVRDSGVVKFSPLTVFIGNNGSGKSSLIEGLETFQSIVVDGLDEAMNKWRGFENIWNKNGRITLRQDKFGVEGRRRSIEFDLNLNRTGQKMKFNMKINASFNNDTVYIESEALLDRKANVDINVGEVKAEEVHWEIHRRSDGMVLGAVILEKSKINSGFEPGPLPADQSILSYCFTSPPYQIDGWQFLNLNPENIGKPRPQKRAGNTTKLLNDGSNLGDYLLDILRHEEGKEIFEGIIQTLKYVLPYAKDVQPALTTQLQRTIYLQLSEGHFQVPGWLLSTGTLRVLALLAVLRHPKPPPLLCIEEIENGLDPRTLNLIVDEIGRATQSGKTQVVCTTHSPYFLDLVPLSSLIVVERDESGQPTFTRPDAVSLGEWATKFAPGQLYTMSQLTRS